MLNSLYIVKKTRKKIKYSFICFQKISYSLHSFKICIYQKSKLFVFGVFVKLTFHKSFVCSNVIEIFCIHYSRLTGFDHRVYNNCITITLYMHLT